MTEFDVALSHLTNLLLLVVDPLARASTEPTFAVFAEISEPLYQTGRELFHPGAQRTALSLTRLLQKRSESDLWHMIQHYALDVTGLQREGDLRMALAEALTDEGVVLDALPRLPISIREVFSWLLEQGGQAPLQTVRTHFALNDDALFALLTQLEANGLAFDTLSPHVVGLHLLFVPQALRECLRTKEIAGSARQERLVPLPASPATVDEGMPVLVGNLALVVNAVYQQRMELTREGVVLKRCTTRIQPLLRGRIRPGMFVENTYLDLLFETAERLLLIQRVHPPFSIQSLRPYYEPGPGIGAWSRLSLEEQTQRLLSWWMTSPHWRDVIDKDFRQWDTVGWKPLAARPLLISALQYCVPGVWYRIDDLLQHIWETEPYALHPAYQDRAQGRHPTAVLRTKWLRCEGAVLRGMLTSTLWELGLVSIGSASTPGQEMQASPDAFELTELGAALLQLVPSPGESTSCFNGDSLALLPTGEVLLLECDTVMLYRFLPFVEIRQLDRAIHLSFTRSSVTQGIDHGLSLEELVAWLETHRKQLPQNVLYLLCDWAKNYVVADLNHVLLLALSSEDMVRLLTTAPRYRSWGFRQLTPNVITAPAHTHLGELQRALQAEGIVVHLGKDMLAYPSNLSPQNECRTEA